MSITDNCQIEIDNLNEQAAEEILQVEVRFNEMRRPHYAKRAEIIAKVPDFWSTAVSPHLHSFMFMFANA